MCDLFQQYQNTNVIYNVLENNLSLNILFLVIYVLHSKKRWLNIVVGTLKLDKKL